MGNLSTFGTFTMARLGIYVSQHALNVTGNNISNINTKGYSRQELDQTAMSVGGADRYQSRFDIRENGGVQANGVDQIRDKYLDIRYRNEMTRVGGMEKKLGSLDKLAVIFDEVGKGDDEAGVLEARFNDFVQQVQNLNTQGAGKDDFDSLARKSAEAMVTQFHDYAKQLETLYDTEKAEFMDDLDTVNATLKKIRNLNDSIRMSEAFGGTALTQKDERNLLIDDLSKMIGINVTYEREEVGEGVEVDKLKITTSGEPERTLIDGIYGAQLELRNEKTFDLGISQLRDQHGNLDPVQPNALTTQYAIGETVTGALTDVIDRVETLYFKSADEAAAYEAQLNDYFGTTKPTANSEDPEELDYHGPYFHVAGKDDEPGLKDGEYVIHYHDPKKDNPTTEEIKSNYSYVNINKMQYTELTDTELTGGLQAKREILTEKGEYATEEELERDPDAGTKRGIPYYRAALDTLARKFAEIMNTANVLPDKTIYQMNGNNQFIDKEGNVINTITVGDKLTVNDADRGKLVLKDEYSYYNGGVLFSNNGNGNNPDDITAANISISFNWDHGSVHMLRSTIPNSPSEMQDNLRHFVSLLTESHDFTTGLDDQGTSYFTGTFQEMLTDTIASTLAKDQNITRTMLDNYNATADELYVDRDAVMGVDLNDEAMNMMQFQKAYSAACRLMTTYDGMLDKLINGTAV